MPEHWRQLAIFPSRVRKHKIQEPALLVRLLFDKQALGVARQIQEAHAFVHVGTIGILMTSNFPGQRVLLKLPLLGHLQIKRGVHAPVELVDIHGVQAILQAVIFRLQALDGGFVFLLLVRVAFLQSFGHPGQHFVSEGQTAEDFREFFGNDLFADVGLIAFSLEASAMIIDVAAFLELADQGASAMAAIYQAGKSEIMFGATDLAGIPSVEHALNPFP